MYTLIYTYVSLTLKNQSQLESGCGWNGVLCCSRFLAAVFGRDDVAAEAAAMTPAHPFGHCFSGSSSRLADVLRLDTIRRSNTRSDDMRLRYIRVLYIYIYALFECIRHDVVVSLHFRCDYHNNIIYCRVRDSVYDIMIIMILIYA